MNIVLFYNPDSGHKFFREMLDDIIKTFNEHNLALIPYRLTDETLLERYIDMIDWKSVKKVIIAGGDGTLHVIINAMLNAGINKPIAIFPVGTANDFAQYFKLPTTIDEMVEIALKDKYASSDLGIINGEYFINIASFGNLVDISQKVNNQVKNTIGSLAYYLKGIEEIPKVRPFRASFEMKEVTLDEEIYFALIMNGSSAGGFRKIAPYSDVNDGLLDLILFKKCPVIEYVPLVVKILNGEHPTSTAITYLQTDHVIINCDLDINSDLDGELGPQFPLDISISKQKIKVNVK